MGRLAQRLERPVYTRKVVRSNRTLPTSRDSLGGDVVQPGLERCPVTAEVAGSNPVVPAISFKAPQSNAIAFETGVEARTSPAAKCLENLSNSVYDGLRLLARNVVTAAFDDCELSLSRELG